MIILDTNTLSEVVKPSPSPKVLHWLATQERSKVFTSAITKAEMLYGVELLPAGKRRTSLYSAIHSMFAREFAGRVLAFNEVAAQIFAKIVAERYRLGRSISQFDAAITLNQAITKSGTDVML
jgi:toxin FitB